MKWIKYQYLPKTDSGSEVVSGRQTPLHSVRLPYSAENMELAKQEAWGGAYTVEEGPDLPLTEMELLRTDVDDLTLAMADLLGGGNV